LVNEPEAETLLKKLRYIPMAIAQAAAFISRDLTSIRQQVAALDKDE
jgi:hypothetical protein